MIFMATMSVEQMRAAISVLYTGKWPDRVTEMTDYQVMAIYNRNLDKLRRKAQTTQNKQGD